MCILVIKKPGAAMPTKETLEICYDNNPDGAGFMWLRPDGQMEGKKGYFSFAEFYQEVEKHKFEKKDTVFCHFRIATHGGINKGNCHPFPISNVTSDLQQTHFVSRNAVAHNGILHGLPDEKGISDTMVFIKEILSDSAILNSLDSTAVNYLINSYVEGSRVAVVKEAKLYLYGKFEDVEGVLYSNSSYKSYRAKTYSLSPYKGGFVPSYSNPYTYGEEDYQHFTKDSEYQTFSILDIKSIVKQELIEDGYLLESWDMIAEEYQEVLSKIEAEFDEWFTQNPIDADRIFEEVWQYYTSEDVLSEYVWEINRRTA